MMFTMNPPFRYFLGVLILGALGIFLVACKPAQSQATADTLTWSHPTARTDGSALPLAQIRDTTISWGPSGGPYTDGSVVVAAPATTVDIPRPAVPGNRCYVAMTTDTGNRSSVYTNEVCKMLYANPNPPANLAVSP